MTQTLKGYIFVIISVLAMSNVYIFSKIALKEVSIVAFGFYWFSFAFIFNFSFLIYSKKYKLFKNYANKTYITLMYIGLLETLGTIMFFSAIKTMSNPSIVSFLGNLSPILITIFGVIILKEKLIKIEILGVILTITGAMIISFNNGFENADNFLKGTILIFLANFFYAISTIISKKNINEIDPIILSLNRVVFLLVFSIITLIITNESVNISYNALKYLALGSFLGPFLATFAGYYALKFIEASKASVVGSSKSLFVLITVYIYFGSIPQIYQLIGGAIIVLGVLFVSLGKLISKGKK